MNERAIYLEDTIEDAFHGGPRLVNVNLAGGCHTFPIPQ